MAVTAEELKNMIIDLRMDLVRTNIPSGNCPYAYYCIKNPVEDCNNISCGECKRIFFESMKKEIEEEVNAL